MLESEPGTGSLLLRVDHDLDRSREYRLDMPDPTGFATAIAAAEAALDELGRRLDIPIDGCVGECILALGMARQAIEIYHAVRREAANDRFGISPPIVLRSVAEAAIRLRWMEDSPTLRARMYQADDDRQRLASADPFRTFRARRSGSRGHPVFSRAETTEMRRAIAEVRTEARAAGEPIGLTGAMVPPVEQMAIVTGDTAMRETYDIVYRISSPWAHLEARSLGSHTFEARSDGTHLVVSGGYSSLAVRAMAAPVVAHLIGTTSRICGLGLEAEARIWQDAVVTWPAPLIDPVRP
jgi:hypothetical protein